MSQRFRYWRIARDWTVITLGLSALGAAFWLAFWEPKFARRSLVMTAGSLQGERSRIAETLRDEARKHGLLLTLVETEGSEDALERLADPRSGIELALVQGGLALDDGHEAKIRQVTALYDEPLHLLVRGEELQRDIEARGLPALRGHTINLSVPGSGTHRLATEVLAFAGLKPEEYHASERPYDELERLEPDDLPDAVFMVSTIPGEIAEVLVDRHGYGLAPIPYARAFARWRSHREGSAPYIVNRYIHEATIPAMTYDRDPPVPPAPVTTLATPMLLVARADLDPAVVERLLAVIFESPFAHVDQPPLESALLRARPEIEWHEGTLRYMRRNTPMIAGDMVDLINNEVSLAAALLGGGFFVWQWFRQRFRRVRDRTFQVYILKVADIEQRAHQRELASTLDLPTLLDLQSELVGLRSDALEQFAKGELEGEDLMAGFLALVNDARDHLTRLILHARENIEDQAAQQGRSPEAVWAEAAAAPPLEPAAEPAQAPAGDASGIGPRHSIL